MFFIVYPRWLSRRAQHLSRCRFTRLGRGARQLPTRRHPSSLGPSVHSTPNFWTLRQPCFPLSAPRWLRHPRRSLPSSATGGKGAEKSLFPMFQRSSTENSNATSHCQTVDLASAKLNDLRGGGNVPRLRGSGTPPRSRARKQRQFHRHQQYRNQRQSIWRPATLSPISTRLISVVSKVPF